MNYTFFGNKSNGLALSVQLEPADASIESLSVATQWKNWPPSKSLKLDGIKDCLFENLLDFFSDLHNILILKVIYQWKCD